MKILVTSLPDLKKIPPQRLHHLLKCLSKDHEVIVLCVNAWWLKEREDKYLEESLKNVKILYATKKKINPVMQEILAIAKANSILRGYHLKDFDLHLNFNSLIFGYFISRRMKKKGIPTVFDICDDLINWVRISSQVPAALKPVGSIIAKYLLNRNIEVATKITYTTKSLVDPNMLNLNDKFTLIPNGVNTNLFYECTSAEVREKIGLSQQDIVLGFVGVLEEWVDFEPVFMAVKWIKEQYQNFKVLIIGSGDKLEEIRALTHKYKLSKDFVFGGFVPYEKLPLYVSAMDICLLPFGVNKVTQHALPLKLFEYMACEKPVISTKLRGVIEAVGDRVLYYSNAKELKERILRLYHDEKLRQKLGREGRIFVEQNYSWDKICCKFEDVLLKAVRSGKTR